MKRIGAGLTGLVLVAGLTLSGCAPLLLAGGAVGGYAIAKNSQDSPRAETPSGNKGSFK